MTKAPPAAGTETARAGDPLDDRSAAYLSVLAHELRNPLTAIEGWTELLAADLAVGDADPAVLRRHLERTARTTRRMAALIDRVLAYARDARLPLEKEYVDLDELVHDVIATQGVADVVRQEPLPKALGDPLLLRQVVENLVSNAVKHVVPGRTPEVTVSGTSDLDGTVTVRVADRGPGIPEADREAVFEPFRRGRHGAEGSGLGLAICQQVVGRHGGTIGVAGRDDGPGMVVTFTLPPG